VPLYEEGVAHPELILSDLVYLTRPELLPDYTPRYYQIIE
jgi:iron complex transport system substrate-binding protein